MKTVPVGIEMVRDALDPKRIGTVCVSRQNPPESIERHPGKHKTCNTQKSQNQKLSHAQKPFVLKTLLNLKKIIIVNLQYFYFIFKPLFSK